MPNIKSAMKRVKVNKTKAAANKSRKSNLKTILKNADAACTANSADKADAIRVAIKKVTKRQLRELCTKTVRQEKNLSLLRSLTRPADNLSNQIKYMTAYQ